MTAMDRGDIESLGQAADEELLAGVGRVEGLSFPIPTVTSSGLETLGIQALEDQEKLVEEKKPSLE